MFLMPREEQFDSAKYTLNTVTLFIIRKGHQFSDTRDRFYVGSM